MSIQALGATGSNGEAQNKIFEKSLLLPLAGGLAGALTGYMTGTSVEVKDVLKYDKFEASIKDASPEQQSSIDTIKNALLTRKNEIEKIKSSIEKLFPDEKTEITVDEYLKHLNESCSSELQSQISADNQKAIVVSTISNEGKISKKTLAENLLYKANKKAAIAVFDPVSSLSHHLPKVKSMKKAGIFAIAGVLAGGFISALSSGAKTVDSPAEV